MQDQKMHTYKVRVVTKKGAKIYEVDAKNEQLASKLAERMGRGSVVSVKKVRPPLFESGMSPEERQTFLLRLSAMLASKVGTGEALTLLKDHFGGRIKRVSERMLQMVENGADIAGAAEAIGRKDFPETTAALIKAGAQTGETWKSLGNAAKFEVEMHHVQKSSGKGMISAIFAFLLAAVLTIGTTHYIGPMTMESDLIKNNADKVDVGWIFAAGNIIGIVMIAITVIFLFLIWLGTIGKRMIPIAADKLILKIPYYKDLILSRNNYITLYGLSVLVKSGVRMEEALRLSMEACQKGALKEDLKRGMHAIRNGQPWAQAMLTLHPTDKASLSYAMDREQIANTLDSLAFQYRDIYAQRLASFTPMLQMTAALALSIAGLMLFGMTIMPMLQVSVGMMS